jgi:hypothetical protein
LIEREHDLPARSLQSRGRYQGPPDVRVELVEVLSVEHNGVTP